MRRPILLDNPPPRPLPSVRWSRFLESRYLSMGGLAAGGVAAVLGASIALAMLMPYLAAAGGPAGAALSDAGMAAASSSPVKPPVAGHGLQYVGDVKQDVKQLDRPCEQQTWPYIAAHCLKPASGPKPAVAKVAVDRADIKASKAGAPPPQQTVAAAPAPVVQPAVVLAAAPQTPVPVPAARPAVREQAMRNDVQPKHSRSAAAPRDIRPDARAEARRAYASGGLPPPIIRPQSIHQAAAFSAER